MRKLWYLGAAAATLALLGANAPATDAAGKTFFYVHDNGSSVNEVHGFQFSSDGTMVELPGSPFDTGVNGSNCGGMCQTLAYSKKGRFLFAASETGVVVFSVAKDGVLAVVPGSPFGGQEVLGITTVKRKNKTFVYANLPNSDEVQGFLLNANGTLTELAGSPFATGDLPDGVTSTANALFVANEGGASVSAFRVNNDGTLTEAPGSPFSVSPASLYNLNATPDGRFLYVADEGNSRVFGFIVNPVTAALTPLPGSPFDSNVQTDGGLAVGTGDVIVGIGRATGEPDLQAYRYAKTTGALTQLGGGQEAGTTGILDGGAIDPKKRFLAVSASADDLLRVFEINRTTGALTEVETQNVDLISNNVNGLLFVK